MNVVGVGAGVATSVAAVTWGLPAAVVGVSVAAPVACVYEFFLGSGGALTAREIRAQVDQMKQDSELRAQQLQQSHEQIEQLEHDAAVRKDQLAEQNAQIKRLWEIHAQLRLALKNLAVAGDTFNHFEGVLSEHASTLSDRINDLEGTSSKLDETAAVLSNLTHSLQTHIVERGLPPPMDYVVEQPLPPPPPPMQE